MLAWPPAALVDNGTNAEEQEHGEGATTMGMLLRSMRVACAEAVLLQDSIASLAVALILSRVCAYPGYDLYRLLHPCENTWRAWLRWLSMVTRPACVK